MSALGGKRTLETDPSIITFSRLEQVLPRVSLVQIVRQLAAVVRLCTSPSSSAAARLVHLSRRLQTDATSPTFPTSPTRAAALAPPASVKWLQCHPWEPH